MSQWNSNSWNIIINVFKCFDICKVQDVLVKVNVNIFVVDHKVYSSSQVELLTLTVFVMYLLRYVSSSHSIHTVITNRYDYQLPLHP